MSYEHLAGRLIETQRSMLGPSAVEIARSTGGIAVDDDGTVTEIQGDQRAAVGTLAQRYVDMLGDAAESRLYSAAREFEDELVLPPALGGPDPSERPGVDRAARGPGAADSSPSGGATGAVSDGGTVAVDAPLVGDEFADAVDRTDGVEPKSEPPNDGAASPVPEPVTADYSVASDLPAEATDGDLESVYLLPESDDGWQAPVSVETAVTDLVAEATSVDDGAAAVDAIDPARLVATLDGDDGERGSFVYEGVTVTFHRSGSLAVH